MATVRRWPDINLVEEDYAWITRKLLDVARGRCRGRLVSLLEGGYSPR